MIDNLVIVESPAKAKTIEKFLGKSFKVESSMGHIRDLSKKDFGIDIANNFNPNYIVPDDKKKIVSDLKKSVKNAKNIWLASDEDREGEAIAWHLAEVLNLDKNNIKRIVFHEITKDAIKNAIENYRSIDQNLVDAQQARRILDRIVGFEISPILWKKLKPALSAGRVQSVAVRLIVEREREINNFKSTSSFKITGNFKLDSPSNTIKALLNQKILDKKEAEDFLNLCKSSTFTISDIATKPSKRSPAPPFITSTLQQEASRKLGFSVSQTMVIAQKLYESGFITYMRTDSVNLSQFALSSAAKIISLEYGKEYINTKNFTTKSKSAQEAHEAIRPTDFSLKQINGNATEKKLYELIWKRSVASQMSDAKLEKTNVTIDITNTDKKFIASGEVLIFDGFLKVYVESTDDESEEEKSGLLPPIKSGQKLQYINIEAVERYTYHPPRYTEASLVRKLEELGIGRPSTYAPTISTIQNRGYVLKTDKPGIERNYLFINLTEGKIYKETKTEITGAEKSKLFPDNTGIIVNDFLVEYFKDILDYNFTAKVEKDFDEIASGKIEWRSMIDNFYKKFHPQVEITSKTSAVKKGERLLGNDKDTNKPVSVKMGRFGAYVQIGENQSDENTEKPKYASLRKGQNMETLTFEEAMQLFRLPRTLGSFEENEIVVSIGKFGPYIRHNSKFYSLKKGIDDPYEIELRRAIELIEEKREADKNKVIKEFKEDTKLKILNGRWGPYITFDKNNFKIPKEIKPADLTYEECITIINQPKKTKKRK